MQNRNWFEQGWSPDTAVFEALLQELGERVALAWDDEQAFGNPVHFMDYPCLCPSCGVWDERIGNAHLTYDEDVQGYDMVGEPEPSCTTS